MCTHKKAEPRIPLMGLGPVIVMFFVPASKTVDVIWADTYGVRKIFPV
jgi:hypothetical protein